MENYVVNGYFKNNDRRLAIGCEGVVVQLLDGETFSQIGCSLIRLSCYLLKTGCN